MALNLLKSVFPKRALKARWYSTAHHGHSAVAEGPVETRVVTARVIFPSPLPRATQISDKLNIASATIEGQKNQVAAERDVMYDRLQRFRQAIIDAHEKAGIEYEHDLGPNEFPTGPLTIKGAFGTPERPILVPSDEQSRLVGCQGGAGPRHHEVVWHNVKANKPLCCLECGQIFRLVNHMEWLEWSATEWDLGRQDTVQFFIPEEL